MKKNKNNLIIGVIILFIIGGLFLPKLIAAIRCGSSGTLHRFRDGTVVEIGGKRYAIQHWGTWPMIFRPKDIFSEMFWIESPAPPGRYGDPDNYAIVGDKIVFVAFSGEIIYYLCVADASWRVNHPVLGERR